MLKVPTSVWDNVRIFFTPRERYLIRNATIHATPEEVMINNADLPADLTNKLVSYVLENGGTI